MNREAVLDALAAHAPFDETEAAHRETIAAFVADAEAPFSRSQSDGHVTGSALLLDPTGERLLLLWHTKLARWLQPGGHCEPEIDADPRASALRELLEETEVPPDALVVGDTLFDVDAHVIPARGDEPEHVHHDLRYAFRLTRDWEPSPPCRWILLADAAALPDASLARLAKRAQSISER